MAHFAKVNNGKVIKVIVAEPDFFDDFRDDSPGTWLQTSYNTYRGVHYDPETGEPSVDQSKALRYNFAGVDYNYDAAADAFYPPQPFPSWQLDENIYDWVPPVAKPEDDTKNWIWHEGDGAWVEDISMPPPGFDPDAA